MNLTRLPVDIIINHVIPFTYKTQAPALLQDIKDYTKTYEIVQQYTETMKNDRNFLEEYVLEEYGMTLSELLLQEEVDELPIYERHLSQMSIRYFFYKMIHNNLYDFVEICQKRCPNLYLLRATFHQTPISQQFRVLWAKLLPHERTTIMKYMKVVEA